MKLASYNLENLFDRAKALNRDTWAEGRPVLDAFARMSKLLDKPTYSAADRTAILDGLQALGVLERDDAGPFVLLRQNRGRLLKRPNGKPVQVVAGGRGEWIGWLELKTGPVNEVATRNTAQVLRDVGAEVVGVIEVDSRIAVKRFNEQLMPSVGARPYAHVMVIEGNDDRGIDVGLLTKAGYEITAIRSHVDDEDTSGLVFSRDCPEYEIATPSGARVLVLVNHLKSKGFGGFAASNARRRREAQRVRAIYDARRRSGAELVAVIGDLNDTPDSDALQPLLGAGSDLRDVSTHPNYQDDGRPGTFANGTKSQKIDYLLLSPALFSAVTAAGVFRKGVWGGKHGDLWEVYPEMTKAAEAASDHAALWAELSI